VHFKLGASTAGHRLRRDRARCHAGGGDLHRPEREVDPRVYLHVAKVDQTLYTVYHSHTNQGAIGDDAENAEC